MKEIKLNSIWHRIDRSHRTTYEVTETDERTVKIKSSWKVDGKELTYQFSRQYFLKNFEDIGR